jgi:hypothetical protein
MEAIQVSAVAATLAYKASASSFQRWATALAHGEGLSVDEAADLKVQNEKAAEYLINAATPAAVALLKPPSEPKMPMDRFAVTRAQRTALRDGLKDRFPAAGTLKTAKERDAFATAADTHAPDLAAQILHNFLSNPRYKAADEP